MAIVDKLRGLLNRLLGSPASIRDTLFGDRPLNLWPPEGSQREFPWSEFAAARAHVAANDENAAIVCWRKVLNQPGLEPRHYAQAWHFLRQFGCQPAADEAKNLLGVVVEVGMPGGLDLLAAYPDYSARYYNYSATGVIWEHPDHSLDAAIDRLLDAARETVKQIGPWEGARPAPPAVRHVRLSFLTPSGIHFGQGPLNTLSKDPIGAGVLEAATALMKALIDKQMELKHWKA